MSNLLEEVTKFIEVCNWDRSISQYIDIKNIDEDKAIMIVEYTVPFQRELKTENNFCEISKKYFSKVTIKRLSDGLGSGTYNIVFNYLDVDLHELVKFRLSLEEKANKKLAEMNAKDKESKILREGIIEREVAPLERKLNVLRKIAEETNDKYMYHRTMLEIETGIKEIQLIRKRFR